MTEVVERRDVNDDDILKRREKDLFFEKIRHSNWSVTNPIRFPRFHREASLESLTLESIDWSVRLQHHQLLLKFLNFRVCRTKVIAAAACLATSQLSSLLAGWRVREAPKGSPFSTWTHGSTFRHCGSVGARTPRNPFNRSLGGS